MSDKFKKRLRFFEDLKEDNKFIECFVQVKDRQYYFYIKDVRIYLTTGACRFYKRNEFKALPASIDIGPTKLSLEEAIGRMPWNIQREFLFNLDLFEK